MDIHHEIDRIIDAAIEEDIGQGDITAQACIPVDATAYGVLSTKQKGILAGLPFLERIFQKVDNRIQVKLLVNEGSSQKAGSLIAVVEGPARGILSAERTVLNLLQHASGVATMADTYVRKLMGYDCLLLDTRATLPGLRALEKYAIQIGGGTIHRYGLHDKFVIKRSYLQFLGMTLDHPINEAIAAAKQFRPKAEIEVEIGRYEDLQDALQDGVTAIMLENMPPTEVARCVKTIHKHSRKAYAQGSAGISLDTIREYAETGVDGISVGELAHAADQLRMSLKLASRRESLKQLSSPTRAMKNR
jgi:nicotinate-nucleotide pyrophosphorylase (carboxylating)